MRQVIEQELQRSFSNSPSAPAMEPADGCPMLFTANMERSCAQNESEYQLGQVAYWHLLVFHQCL